MMINNKTVLLSLFIISIGVLVTFSGLGEDITNTELEWMHKFRGPAKPPDEIAIISIENYTSNYLQEPAEIHTRIRKNNIKLLNALGQYDTSVLAYDIFFEKPRVEQIDRQFAATIRNYDNILLVQKMHWNERFDYLQNPLALFSQSPMALAPFPLPKIPVKVNYFWPFFNVVTPQFDGERNCNGAFGFFDSANNQSAEHSQQQSLEVSQVASMPVAVMLLHALNSFGRGEFVELLKTVEPEQFRALPDVINNAAAFCELSGSLRLALKGNRKLLDKLAQYAAGRDNAALLKTVFTIYSDTDKAYLNYYGPQKTIPTYFFSDLFDAGGQAIAAQFEKLENKIIFIGGVDKTAIDQVDGFPSVFTTDSGVDLSGVEIAATATANLLGQEVVKKFSHFEQFLVIAVFGFLLSQVSLLITGTRSLIVLATIAGIYFLLCSMLFKHLQILAPFFVPLCIQLILVVVISQCYKYLVYRKSLGYYLPPSAKLKFEKTLVSTNKNELINAVCLITDIADYTRLSERINPDALADYQNKYFTLLSNTVKKYSGETIATIGDSFTAIWTDQDDMDANRRHACLAATTLHDVVAQFNRENQDLDFQTRIGLHQGYVAVGNIGGGGHYSYTISGDVINTTSRIESLNKILGTKVLASEDVVKHNDTIPARKLGTFKLKGKLKFVVIYQLLTPTDENLNYLEFDKGMRAIEQGNWDEAYSCFKNHNRNYPQDGPGQFYLNLTEHHLDQPESTVYQYPVVIDKK